MEALGAKVVPVFAGGLDFSSPVKKFFYEPLGSGKSFVDAVVSLTGFALVGGPARQDAPKAVDALKKLGRALYGLASAGVSNDGGVVRIRIGRPSGASCSAGVWALAIYVNKNISFRSVFFSSEQSVLG